MAEVMAHDRNVIRAARDSGVARSVAGSGLDADPSSDEVHRLTGCSPTLLLPLEGERPYSRSAWSDCRLVRGRREDVGDVAVRPITLFDRHGLSLAVPVAATACGYGSSATQNGLIRATVSAGQRAETPSSELICR
jgi:hypothetical protein